MSKACQYVCLWLWRGYVQYVQYVQKHAEFAVSQGQALTLAVGHKHRMRLLGRRVAGACGILSGSVFFVQTTHTTLQTTRVLAFIPQFG